MNINKMKKCDLIKYCKELIEENEKLNDLLKKNDNKQLIDDNKHLLEIQNKYINIMNRKTREYKELKQKYDLLLNK